MGKFRRKIPRRKVEKPSLSEGKKLTCKLVEQMLTDESLRRNKEKLEELRRAVGERLRELQEENKAWHMETEGGSPHVTGAKSPFEKIISEWWEIEEKVEKAIREIE